MVKIAILGAGINGVTCALRIKETYLASEVVIISDEFTPNTTGDGSGGLWYPYLCGNTPEALLTKWGGETYNYLHKLWLEGDYSISLMPMYALYRQPQEERRPKWSEDVYGYEELQSKHLDYLSQMFSAKYVAGHTFTSFVVQPPKLISHLFEQFKRAGGLVIPARVQTLSDPLLQGYDVVVNCTGVAARTVVPDDRVFPIRGQIFKVKAPWINATIVDQDSGHYIIPNAETCILGGTHQEHDFNTKPNDEDSKFIFDGCKNMIPGLKYAEIIDTWVGLRPGRHEVRIDSEEQGDKLLIHNYGHGGSGLTLFWGCASDVLRILDQHFNKNTHNITSKL